MRQGLFAVVFGALALGIPPGQAGQQPTFDDVILAKVEGGDLLYLVVFSDAKGRDLDKLVVQLAKPALAQAASHKFKGTTKTGEKHQNHGNIVYAVRKKGVDDSVEFFVSPFSVEQLREIVDAGPGKGEDLAFAHNWTLGKLPRKK